MPFELKFATCANSPNLKKWQMRRFQVLLLGVETPAGQVVLRRFRENFPIFKVAVPTFPYPEHVQVPPYQVPVDLNDEAYLTRVFASVEVVVSCSARGGTQKVKAAAGAAGTRFIDASFSYPEVVIASCFERFSFRPVEMEAHQRASGLGFSGFWKVAHGRRAVAFPSLCHGAWAIEQNPVLVGDVSVKHRISFTGKVWAVLFWLWALVVRFLFPVFGDGKTHGCVCDWRFFGLTEEHGKRYLFETDVSRADGDVLLPDLLTMKALDGIGVKHDECCDWPAFGRLSLKLNSYTPQKE